MVLLVPRVPPAYTLAHVSDKQMFALYDKKQDFKKEVGAALKEVRKYEHRRKA